MASKRLQVPSLVETQRGVFFLLNEEGIGHAGIYV